MADPLYTNLRDGTAANLIGKFGRSATLRKVSASVYDPATGKATNTTQDTPVEVLEVSLRRALKGRDLYQHEMDQIKQWDSGLVMSAKETAAAGVTPSVGDLLIFPDGQARIAWLEPTQPGGVAVVYKMAITKL